MIRGNCGSLHVQMKNTSLCTAPFEKIRFMNRCDRQVLSGAKGLFTRNEFLAHIRSY